MADLVVLPSPDPNRKRSEREKRALARALKINEQTRQALGIRRSPMATVPELHALTAIDEAQRRAICGTCGPVKVFRSGGGWRCSIAHAEYKRLKRAEDKKKRGTLRSETRCCGLPFDLPPLPAGQSHTTIVVRCICGQTRAIRRLHMRSDRSDRLTWIEAAEVYADGVRQYVVSAEQFQWATHIDLRSI